MADTEEECATCGGNGYVCATCGHAAGDCVCEDGPDEDSCPDCGGLA